MSLPDAKAAARRAARAARGLAHGQADPEPALDRAFRWLCAQPQVRRISAYAPIRSEIDPLPLMARLHAAGREVCLPVVEGPARPLSFRAWAPGMALEAGAFGAAVPPAGPAVTPDAVIAPLLAFDRRCYRLGYGGGFYDRTLAALRQGAPTPAIGLAYSAQEIASVPTEPTDVPLDAIATERELILP